MAVIALSDTMDTFILWGSMNGSICNANKLNYQIILREWEESPFAMIINQIT